MTEFWHAVEWFVWGFLAGWLASPFWALLTKIIEEAKIAKHEWHKGPKQ